MLLRLLKVYLLSIGFLVTVQASVSYPPPTSWKAINYSPRYHSYNAMLWDWNATDATTGQTVSTMVDNDLQTLGSNGFNVLSLYLWDKSILAQVSNPSNPDPRGFCSRTSDPGACSGNGDPSNSPDASGTTGQLWSNLDSFLTTAENRGFYVILAFANGEVIDQLRNSSNCSAITTYYNAWTKKFVDHFAANHNNILAWGQGWGWGHDGVFTCSNAIWAPTYAFLRSETLIYYSSRPLQAKVITGFNLQPFIPGACTAYPQDIIPRGGGYCYSVSTHKQTVSDMCSDLNTYYNSISDTVSDRLPDYFAFGGYNANSKDFYDALISLTSSPKVCVSEFPSTSGTLIPASRIHIGEFGTSSGITEGSGLTSWPLGLPNGWFPYALTPDSQVPLSTRAGQEQWLKNAVCALQAASVTKHAYWNMYDPYAYWTSGYQGFSLGPLAMHAYFGLKTEGGTSKGAWTALVDFNQGSLSCPSPSNAPPVLEAAPGTPYTVTNQSVRFYWEVADASSLGLNQSTNGSKSCLTGSTVAASSLDGSCAYAEFGPFYSNGTQTATMTASNGTATPATAGGNVSVGSAPTISTITDSAYSTTINTGDVILVWGAGLNVDGGNTIQLHNNSTSADYWCYAGSGDPAFFGTSYHLVGGALGYCGGPPAGNYTVYIRNPNNGNPSAGFSLTII